MGGRLSGAGVEPGDPVPGIGDGSASAGAPADERSTSVRTATRVRTASRTALTRTGTRPWVPTPSGIAGRGTPRSPAPAPRPGRWCRVVAALIAGGGGFHRRWFGADALGLGLGQPERVGREIGDDTTCHPGEPTLVRVREPAREFAQRHPRHLADLVVGVRQLSPMPAQQVMMHSLVDASALADEPVVDLPERATTVPAIPVSSATSRIAVCSAVSPVSIWPLGSDHIIRPRRSTRPMRTAHRSSTGLSRLPEITRPPADVSRTVRSLAAPWSVTGLLVAARRRLRPPLPSA